MTIPPPILIPPHIFLTKLLLLQTSQSPQPGIPPGMRRENLVHPRRALRLAQTMYRTTHGCAACKPERLCLDANALALDPSPHNLRVAAALPFPRLVQRHQDDEADAVPAFLPGDIGHGEQLQHVCEAQDGAEYCAPARRWDGNHCFVKQRIDNGTIAGEEIPRVCVLMQPSEHECLGLLLVGGEIALWAQDVEEAACELRDGADAEDGGGAEEAEETEYADDDDVADEA